MINRKFIYFAIAFVSAGMIAFEAFMIRFFSLAHFGAYIYIPISVAVLGIGSAATVISVFEEKIRQNLDFYLGLSLALGIFFTSLGFFVLKQIELHPAHLFKSFFFLRELLGILSFYFFLILPFFFAGFFLVLSYHVEKEHLGHVSIFDLGGAAIGAVAFLAAIFFVPVAFQIYVPICLLAVGAFLIISKEKKYRLILFSLTIIALLLPFVKSTLSPMSYKDLFRSISKGGEQVYESESYQGQLKVLSKPAHPLIAGLSEDHPSDLPIEFMDIFLDGNRISEFVNGKKQEFLDYSFYKAIYALKPEAKTLVLNSGGGLGVLAAIRYNASKIHAVERNHQIIQLLKDRFSRYTGGIYHHRNVLFYRSEIRAFAKSHDKKYSLVLFSLPHLLNKGYLQEADYRVTTDAFAQYLGLLNKGGVFVLQVFMQKPARLELQIAKTFKALLDDEKIDAKKALSVFKTKDSLIFMVKPSGFAEGELSRFNIALSDLRFAKIFPNSEGTDLYSLGIKAIFDNNDDYFDDYNFSIRELTDKHPFPFYSLKFKAMFSSKDIPNSEVGYLVLWLALILVIIISVVVTYLPVIIKKDYKKKMHLSKAVVYFGGIGLGYMFIEIVMIQKMYLLFANFFISASIVLASTAMFSGLGAYLARRFPKKTTGIFVTIGALAVVLLFYFLLADSILHLLLGLRLLYRLIAAFFIFAPLSFLMAMPFALGLEWIKYFDERIIPWCWSVYTGFSVIGTVLAMLLSLDLGLNWVWLIAILFYGISVASFLWMDIYYQKTNYLYRRYKV